MQYEALENPNIATAEGAGIKTARLVADKGAQVALTGNIGPNALDALLATGVEVITGVRGTVSSAVKRYLRGQFQSIGQPAIPAHFRKCSGLTRRRSGGFGPGGMGPMVPMGTGVENQPSASQSESKILKGQAEALKQRLEEINHRIEELEGK